MSPFQPLNKTTQGGDSNLSTLHPPTQGGGETVPIPAVYTPIWAAYIVSSPPQPSSQAEKPGSGGRIRTPHLLFWMSYPDVGVRIRNPDSEPLDHPSKRAQARIRKHGSGLGGGGGGPRAHTAPDHRPTRQPNTPITDTTPHHT
jgi:hypothetical protein